MNLIFEHKHATEVTNAEKRYIKKLKLTDIGLIWDDFVDYQTNTECFVILTKNNKKIPIAWGLILYDYDKEEWVFSVYVKRTYRRKGIGTKIYRMMKRKHKLKDNDIHVFRHDDKSMSFFDKLQR